MSEANEVTEIVERVREHLAAAVGIGHPDEEGYIDFLTEILAALTAATERAEAAEAATTRAMRGIEVALNEHEACKVLLFRIEELKAERDALRKDAARYRWLKPQLEMDWDLGNPVYLSLGLTVEVPTHVEVSFDLDATIDAALAVQP